MTIVWQDLRQAVRGLRRSFGFATLAAFVLALGVGTTSTMFALVDAALVRPLPFFDPARLVMIWERPPSGAHNRVAPLNYLDWSEQNQTFSAIAAVAGGSRTMTGTDWLATVNPLATASRGDRSWASQASQRAECSRLPADWESMGRRTPFAEVLEEKLGLVEPPPQSPIGRFGHRATVHAFVEFTAASQPVSGWHPRHPYAAPDVPLETPKQQPTRSKRRLSWQEREALDQLNTLGAAISPDFTAEELRSAFRSLALTFHPDRHHRSTGAEAACLSRNFIALHDAYRTLQIVVPAAA